MTLRPLTTLACAFSAVFAQTSIPQSLIVENIPPIPVALEEAKRPYDNVRAASLASWAPNGNDMLILTRFAETTQLHRVEKPMGARQQLTFLKEPVSGGLYSPNAEVNGFLYSKDDGGNEYYQIYFFDAGTGKAALLTDGTSRNELGPWSNSGKEFAYSSNRTTGKDTHVFIGAPDGPEAHLIVNEEGTWHALDWSPDDGALLVQKYVSINESELWIVDVRTGTKRQINPSSEKIAYGGAEFSKDSKGIYLTSDEKSEFQTLRYLDLANSSQSVLTGEIPWDVTEFAQSDDGNFLAFVANADGVSRLHVIKTKGRRPVALPPLPLGRIYGLRFHPDNRHFGLTMNTPKSPGDVFVIDLKTKGLERWTKSEVGGMNTDRFAEPELVSTKSFDGLPITGFLYRPPTPGPHPIVVTIHGGPESQYVPNFSSTIQYWVNELGLAVLAPNVRGSSGYGKTFLQLDNGRKREDSVRDIGAFLDWIGTRPDLDARRVAVHGGSYGGYMVLASMTHFSDRLAAAVDVVGISNFVTFLESTKDYRRDLRRAEYGDERDPQMREFLVSISPTERAEAIRKPMLIVQGYNDPRVPYGEAVQIRDKVRASGADVWFLVGKDEGHGFSKKPNVDYYTSAVALFWKTFLLGEHP